MKKELRESHMGGPSPAIGTIGAIGAIGAIGPEDRTVPTPPRAALRPEDRGAGAPGPPLQRAGDYVLGAVLAEGGFGVVIRATHATRGTPAAVKILHSELISRQDVLRRFEREVEAIRRIRHRHVIDIFDFGWLADGRPYFAMELLAGRNLDEHLFARGRLPAGEAIEILEPLCSALAAAHERGIVHRDIKPSNVFLCDGDGRVVLLDFGVAKLLDAPGPGLTTSRQVIGTPAFMSPEQLLHQPVDARTDIYALGALFYTMITGAPPFHDSAYPVLRQLHLHSTPANPSSRAPVSPAFDGVILRALRKDPPARQPGVDAFLAEVRAAAAQAIGEITPRSGPRGRGALGVHVEVAADPDTLEAPSERFLEDFESILPLATSELAAAGFAPVAEAGTSALFAATLSTDARRGEEARRRAVDAALALHRRLRDRPGRDGRIRVRLCLHAGEIEAPDGDAPTGGHLLDLPAWVPEEIDDGVFASAALLADLGIPAHPGAPAAPGAIPLLRLGVDAVA
jgi:serine/threonine-protein kinase